MNINQYPQFDFSLGVQDATTWILRKPNELNRGVNLRFGDNVGGFRRRDGYARAGDQFSTSNTPTGGHIAKFSNGSRRFVAVNNNANTATIIRVQDSAAGTWSTLSGISYPPNSVIFFKDYLDELYISGFDPATGDPVTPYNVDKTLDVSSTRNLLNCPPCYFFEDFLGVMYAANVKVNSERFPARVYKSSAPLGAVTYVQGAQTDSLSPVTTQDNVPTMTSNTAPFGTAFASSQFDADRAPWTAFDDILENPIGRRWITANGSNTGFIGYDFGAGNAKTITYYSIVGQGPGEDANRVPKTWTFEGSNDGTNYTILDTRTNQSQFAVSEKRVYSINNTTAYRYYRVNVSANQGGALLSIEQLEFLTSLQTAKAQQLLIDSARYVKQNMEFDIYGPGGDTKLYTLLVASVDKVKNLITFIPQATNFASSAVTVAADTITVTDGDNYPTGTPIRFDSTTGSVPGGLSADTLYYSIRVNSTTIKVATSRDNALLNNAIDLTSQGSGTIRVRLSYIFADNAELWLKNRKGKLTINWNTDYPTPQTAEFLEMPTGKDSSNTVSAIGKSSNRLFIWTKNTGNRYDGQNLVTFNNNVGCISQRSVANIDDDWLVWVDQKGNVRVRNEGGGQFENISKAMKRPYLKKLTLDQLKAVSTGVVDNQVKIYLGQIDNRYIRLCYDFDGNTWSPEALSHPALMQSTDDYTGDLKPYFFSSNGRLYMDETGNMDDDQVIPFEAGTGKDMLQSPGEKKFYGIKLFTKNCNGLKFQAAVDGGQMQTIANIEGQTCVIIFPEQGDAVLREGTNFDWQITGAVEGDPPEVEGALVYYVPRGDVPVERR